MKIQYFISFTTICLAGYFAHLDSSAWPWFLGAGAFMFLTTIGAEINKDKR
tara:strand:+ start:129 stop:281 length:153 start_codon:yes stop_codon:yes gene_type:complete